MFGVSNFVSILPPGQGAIMAVAASTPTAVIQKNGMMGMVKQMTVTVTADHRHIYGAFFFNSPTHPLSPIYRTSFPPYVRN